MISKEVGSFSTANPLSAKGKRTQATGPGCRPERARPRARCPRAAGAGRVPPSAHLRRPQSWVGTARSGRTMGTTAGQQLRALFYVVPPGESSFRTLDEVPDYVEKVRAPSPPLSRQHPLPASPPTLRRGTTCLFPEDWGRCDRKRTPKVR